MTAPGVVRSVLAALLALLVAIPALAEAASAGTQTLLLVVLQPLQKGQEPLDGAEFGGTTRVKAGSRLAVLVPEQAVERLQRDPRVRYVQRVVSGHGPRGEAPSLPVAASAVTRLAPVVNGSASVEIGPYSYDGAGNIHSIEGTLTGSNQIDTFTYDGAGRLESATVHAYDVGHTESYGYDAAGNLTRLTSNGTTIDLPVDNTTNRLRSTHGFVYDGVGNMVDSPAGDYRYDQLEMLKWSQDHNTRHYIYTADDERLAVVTGGEFDADAPWTWTLRDLDRKPVREYETFGDWDETHFIWTGDHFYAGGKALAAQREAIEGGLRHFHLDHLGTPRLVTNSAGGRIATHVYYPFGVEITSVMQERSRGYTSEEHIAFTGHERDGLETWNMDHSAYLDYMHARYYSPHWGRFLSVDPGGWDRHRPQTWNRYVYAENNPILKVDPDGRQAVAPFPSAAPTTPLSLSLMHAQQMRSSSTYRRAVMNGVRTLQGATLGMLGVFAAVSRPFLVTPLGTVLPGGKDVNLVPTATGTGGWLQIHDSHPHDGAQPHTHRPETHVGPNGEVDVKRTERPTTAEDIDEADKRVKDGELRPRTDRKDKGDRKREKHEEDVKEQ